MWQDWNIHTVDDLALRLDNFRILFAYNSGKLENAEINYHDTREIFENGKVVGYTGSTRTLFEQQNQKVCYNFLQEKIVAKEPLSIELICAVHRALTEGTYDERRYIVNGERPGEFKKHDYVTGREEIGAAPEDVQEEMAELMDELQDLKQEDALTAAAYFHVKFENIHPFADGNGRTGRLAMNYHLVMLGHPPIVVHEEDRKEYYAALEAWDTKQNLKVMISFLRSQTVKTWRKRVEKLK